ncbi:MAG: molybdopterin-guanine dinucleotide biosynthesis protein B [Syntrophomonadaceae bacterium]|jgi:molybdopterin-guanine dinucleotide biosynthesis protein B
MMVPIISFVGRHNSGKTHLLTRIIPELSKRGITTAVIKHAHHKVNITGNKDSELLFTAGAKMVYTASPDITILYQRTGNEKTLEEMRREIGGGVHLVITEGYKNEDIPKIEVLRKEISTIPLELNNVIARVADFNLNSEVPVFDFTQGEEIAAFLLQRLKVRPELNNPPK